MRDQMPTPPADASPLSQRMHSDPRNIVSSSSSLAVDDNTVAGILLSQEDALYLTPAASPTAISPEEKECVMVGQNDNKPDDDVFKNGCQVRERVSTLEMTTRLNAHGSEEDQFMQSSTIPCDHVSQSIDEMEVDQQSQPRTRGIYAPVRTSRTPSRQDSRIPSGLAKVDLDFNRASQVPRWDFSNKRPVTKYPSALFQPYAKYIGTQQSDRHTYNVEVTILTVDVDQSCASGYLLINGLTPEHPTLQTFFTGQVIGGPNQRYSFKTADPSWGANDKVDLQHWLRFPPWRHLSSHAKRDMRFDFPLNGEPWWSQPHVFMRWKEHFLVPDHKQSNITGASFEGFYYICLNLVEGKISGVYFHGKSERYQQLELTHETKRGLGVFGVSPLVELR